MYKSLFFFFSLFVFTCLNLTAQDNSNESWHCLTDEINREILEKSPEARLNRTILEDFIDYYVNSEHKNDDEVYIIPVVVHIVHDYGFENISHDQVVESIDYMNRDFRRLRSDTTQIVDEFKNLAADSRIEFRLARKDPDGNCTVGVTRTASETTYSGGEAAKIAAPAWPTHKYLNVWIVRSLPRGAAGWAYYPGTAPEGRDGVIMLHSYLGSTGTSNAGRATTLTHEVGHYLNLAHPWGPTNEPGIQSNCEIDDGIEDTPNTIGWSTCTLNGFSCGSLDNVQNFMEYSYCGKMFTKGQADVMRAVLNSSVAGRNNLWTEQNLWETGVHDDFIPEICEPIADFSADRKVGCLGMTVNFINFTHNTDVIDSVYWMFNGSQTDFSSEFNPEVTFNEAGIHSVKLYAFNEVNESYILKEDFIQIYDCNDAFEMPYGESFDQENFPYIDNSSNGFYIQNFSSGNWEQTAITSYSGSRSIRIRPTNNPIGSSNYIMLPLIKVDTTQPIEVSFYAAHGRVGGASSDRLRFYVSYDCGETKRIVNVLGTSQLATANVHEFTNYIPMPFHWKQHSFVIPDMFHKSENMRLIIEAEAGGGNNIYIDEVAFTYPSNIEDVSKSINIAVYPNPFSDEIIIDFHGNSKELTLHFYNSAGQIIASEHVKESQYDASAIFMNQASGLYFVRIESDSHSQILKIVKE